MLSLLLPLHTALALATPLPVAAPVVPEYYVVDLGTFGPPDIGTAPGSVPLNLGPDGSVVGYSVIDEYAENLHAFRHSRSGGMQELPPLAGDPHSQAWALDATGTAVGISYHHDSGLPRAVAWVDGVPTLLGTFEPHDVNAAGQVVGHRSADGTPIATIPVLWNGSGLVDLGSLGGTYGTAAAIHGDRIVGQSTNSAGVQRAFLWSNGSMQDLGTLGGAASRARDIAGRGRVVGSADTAGGTPHAVLFRIDSNDTVTHRVDLGTLGGASHAFSINEAGVVVGNSNGRAFRWQRAGGMVDLNTLIPANAGWQLAHAAAIDDAGRIAGFGMHRGLPRGFLLVPLREKGI